MRGGFRCSVAAWVLAAYVGFGSAGIAFANTSATANFPFIGNDDVVITVNKDGTAQQTWTRRVKLLSEAAVEANGKIATPYRETLQSVEVLEAYTDDYRTELVAKLRKEAQIRITLP
jgi:hypothetical protein